MDEQKHKHLERLVRHIEKVQQSCNLLGQRLIEAGEEVLGLELIANGQIHDNSKFRGIEWEYLHSGEPDVEKRMIAHKQHVTFNKHHPESWAGGIKEMPAVFLAEMVCDWHARGSELGTDVREWITTTAAERYDFTLKSQVYKQIKRFVDMLLERGL